MEFLMYQARKLSSIDSSYTSNTFPYLSKRNEAEISEILCEIFAITLLDSQKIVSKARWMQEHYSTPRWGNKDARDLVLRTIK